MDNWKGARKQYRDVVLSYRIAGCRVLTARDSPIGEWGPVWPGAEKDRDHAWLPGDIRLDIHLVWCRRDLRGCARTRREEAAAEAHLLRRLDDGRWRLVDWMMGDVFPLQGHVGEPCRPEDSDVRILTLTSYTSTSQCVGSEATPLCALETTLAEGVKSDQARDFEAKVFLKYKIVDCETLAPRKPVPGQWDPRPMTYPWGPGREPRNIWEPGDVRLAIRMQTCNAVDDTCKSLREYITVSRNYDGRWGTGWNREREAPGRVE